MLKQIGLLLFCMSLVGCNSMHQRQYAYHEPHTAQGKSCVVKCQHSRTQCQHLCAELGKYCECDADYRACFELCGGRVAVETYCVGQCTQYS